MKNGLIALLTFASVSAFAQMSPTATQVCQKIATINGSNGSVCAQLISRNTFDPASLSLAYKAVDKGTSIAIQILQTTANRRLDMNAGQVCENILNVNSANAIACVTTVLDTVPSPELTRIANTLVAQGSSYAVQALQAGANAYLFPPLADICTAMASVNASNTVVCVQTIANKVSMNGAEQICRTSLNQGSSYALQCIQGVVMDYTPIPQPTTIMVQEYQLQDLKRAIMKSRAQLDRGLIDNARRSLDEAAQTIDLILHPNQVR